MQEQKAKRRCTRCIAAAAGTGVLRRPRAGVICFAEAKDLVEKARGRRRLNAMAKAGFRSARRRERPISSSSPSRARARTTTGVVSGWGRLVLDKDISGELSATFTTRKRPRKRQGDERYLGQLAETGQGRARDQAPRTSPASLEGQGRTAWQSRRLQVPIPGSAIEKLLAKDKKSIDRPDRDATAHRFQDGPLHCATPYAPVAVPMFGDGP